MTYEIENLLVDEGKLCLDTSAVCQTMKKEIKDNLVDIRTTVKYKSGETKTLHGINNTMSLEDNRIHQESRLRSCKSRSTQHLDCYWNNL